MFNAQSFLDAVADQRRYPLIELIERPVTIRDMERLGCVARRVAMEEPMADPCPNCGAFRLDVGCWVCVGACNVCWNAGYGST